MRPTQRCGLILICCAVSVISSAHAQNAATLARFAKEAHTGPAEQALVGVTTTFRGKQNEIIEIRHGNGIVLRCDGFILFPAGLLQHRDDEPDDVRPSIKITLRPGTREEQQVTAVWPRYVSRDAPLRIVKLSNVHTPALRTLLLDTMKPGEEITVAWLPWDESRGTFGPVQKRPAHYNGISIDSKKPGVTLFQEPVPGVPSGAVVIGTEEMGIGIVPGQAAPAARTDFLSMETLAFITNCVVPVPTPDSLFQGDKKDDSAASQDNADPNTPKNTKTDEPGDEGSPQSKTVEMVKIPGGPIALPVDVRAYHTDMEGASIACIAPFEMDKYEVTNQQYWNFWNRLPKGTEKERAFQAACWPRGWAKPGKPFPDDLNDVPVLGVTLAGARAYARSQGKRLPTPCEWLLAAFGPQGDRNPPTWMPAYVADRNSAALQIKQAHMQFLSGHAVDLHTDDFVHPSSELVRRSTFTRQSNGKLIVTRDNRIHGLDFLPGIPWIVAPEWDWKLTAFFDPALQQQNAFGFRLDDRLEMQTWSKQTIDPIVDAMRRKWQSPLYVLPVGSRAFDSSLYGVSDMLFNARELVAPSPFVQPSDWGYTMSIDWLANTSQELSGDLLTAAKYPVKSSDEIILSRLIAGLQSARVARWIETSMNIRDASAMFRVLSGWTVSIQPAIPLKVVDQADCYLYPIPPGFPGEPPYWLHQIWSGPSKYAAREFGSSVNIDLLIRSGQEDPTAVFPHKLAFLEPIGFRCAR